MTGKGNVLELEYLDDLKLFEDSFEYRERLCKYEDVKHIQFTATVTQHSVNFVKTGKTYDVQLFVHFRNGDRLKIDKEERFIDRKKKERFEEVMHAASVLMDVTFNQRVEQYEEQMASKGFVTFGRHQISNRRSLSR